MAYENQSNSPPSFLNSLNNVGEYTSEPAKKLVDLISEQKYEVIKVRAVNTGFGRALVAHLIDADKKEIQTFLPKRIANFLDCDEAVKMFAENVKYMRVSKGNGLKNVNLKFFS